MSDLPSMTDDEARDLISAVQAGFGNCLCGASAAIAGHLVQIETCAGHQFLQEPHRLDRLLWIRRTYPFWSGKEHEWKLSDSLQRAIDEALA